MGEEIGVLSRKGLRALEGRRGSERCSEGNISDLMRVPSRAASSRGVRVEVVPKRSISCLNSFIVCPT